jgi:molybdopterin-guanine dinucleotide biosynthesis protein B
VHRAALGKPLIHPNDSWIVAVASDAPLAGVELPVISLNDIETIADVLLVESMPIERLLEHDPEKWSPVFGKDHAPKKGRPG